MKLNMFLTSLLPSFSKSVMKKALDETRRELREETLTQYKAASSAGFDKRKWKAEVNKQFQEQFDRHVKLPGYRGNMIAICRDVLKNVDTQTTTLENLIDDYFSNDIIRESVTFLGCNLIQFQEALAFVTRYSRKLLLYVITEEVRAADPSQVDERAILQGEINWLYSKRESFFQALHIVSLQPKEVEEKIRNVPDIIATKDNIDQVNAMVGMSRTDPFSFGFISARMNPIFYVRKWLVEGQVEAYKEAQEERKQLECRILQLKNQDEGKQDPKLQQAIEYNEQRLHRIQATIAEMEADNE